LNILRKNNDLDSKIADIAKLIEEVEEALYSSETDIIECLKKTRVIARYYNDTDIEKWIRNELTGYKVEEEFPEYRKIPATLYSSHVEVNRLMGYSRKYNQYHGTADHPYNAPINDIIKRSKEDKIELTLLIEGEQIPILIRGMDLQNIVTEINLKLTDYIHEKVEEISKRPYETPLMKIFNRFHRAARQLEKRYSERETIIISDEYDTQDLLRGLLSIEFDSVQAEEYGPRFAGKRPRIDFFLRLESTGIEVKRVRDEDHANKLNEEIIIDKEYYSNNPNITQLYFFIYDPNALLLQRIDFIEDLEKNKSEQFQFLKIVIKPDL